jgi:hypothetical protein
MAVSGDSILVGAPGVFHEVGEAQGAVDVFALGDDGFTRLGRLDPPDPAADYERYGAVLAAEGDLAAVTSTSFFGTSDSTPGWVRILPATSGRGLQRTTVTFSSGRATLEAGRGRCTSMARRVSRGGPRASCLFRIWHPPSEPWS